MGGARTWLGAALMSGAALAVGGAARAQDAAPADEDGVIVVTAQKRAQSTLDVGINLAVADGETLIARRIDDATDLSAIAPNVTVKENVPGLVPVITIRGVGLNDFSATNNPSAGVYIDEVSLSSLALMNFDFFDLARVELLKGPQGTLYGRTATAGALNIVSATPDLAATSGLLRGTLGNYELKEVEGNLNLPLSETLAMRLSGKGIFQGEGFWFNERLDRDIGRRNVGLGRAQLLWEPSARFQLLLKAEVQHARSELGGPEFFGAIPTPLTPPGVTCPGAPQCSDFLGYSDLDGDPFRGSYSVDPSYDLDQLNLTARMEADLGFATLVSITGYIDFDRQWSADTDAGPLPQLDFRAKDQVEQFSQELRLSGDTPLATWLIGAFYSEDTIRTTYAGDLTALLNTTTFTFSDQKSESAALFANAEWKLGRRLTLITGLRYTDESRTNVGGTTDLVSNPPASFLTMAPFGSPPIPLATSDARFEDRNWSWKLGLNWKPVDDMLVYGSITQAWKSGGFFAGVATSSAQLDPYLPEKIVAYEAGVKGRAAAAGLNYSVSAFYYDYSDVQTFIREDIGGIPVQRLGNVGKAEIYGLDADLVWEPRFARGLNLSAGIGLLETRLGRFAAGAGPVAAGNDLPDAPGFSLTGGAAYETRIKDDVSGRVSLNATHQSRVFRDALNDPLIASPGYWTLDARAAVFNESGWEVALWGRNITDERYITQGVNQLPFGLGFRVYGAPRTYGVSISRSFN